MTHIDKAKVAQKERENKYTNKSRVSDERPGAPMLCQCTLLLRIQLRIPNSYLHLLYTPPVDNFHDFAQAQMKNESTGKYLFLSFFPLSVWPL